MGFQKLNKKGLQFSSFFLSLVAFSLVIIASGVIITDWGEAYNQNVTNDLGGLNKLDEVSEDAGSQTTVLSPNDPDPGDNAETNTFRGVYGILTNIYSSFALVIGDGGIIDSVTGRFGIPAYVMQAVVTMIVVSITFAIIAIVFRVGRTTT